MADYTSTVELVLNGLDKLKDAEQKIKALDGKVIKTKLEIDSSGIKKAQDSLKQAFGGGGVGGGGVNTGGITKGVNSYFDAYNKAIKSGLKATERAIGAGEKSYLKNYFEQQSAGYFAQAKQIRQAARQNLSTDDFKDFAIASRQANIAAKADSGNRQDFIKVQQLQQYASKQANLYTKELNGLYASYAKLRQQAIKANVGSTEQKLLNKEALARKSEYESLRSEVESTLSVGQIAQLDYMEQKTQLNLRDAAVTRKASIDAKVTNLNYKNILDSQRRINSLELDRAKISQNESDLYSKYTDAITKEKTAQAGLIANYGKMDDYQQAQLKNLQDEGVYRKQNYDLLHQVGELDKQINSDNFEARLNANSKMKGIYKDEISEVRDLYANAQNETDMRYASKREQALFAQAAASNNTGLSFIDKFKNGLSSFTTMLVGPMALFRYGVTAARAVMANVTQMDAAMTELYKVTDNSQHEYDKFREATKKTSAEIGATQVSLVQSTATFARLGYNLSDSAELGKNAALFANVGDEGMTSTEAAEDMVAIMKGFNIQAEDSIHIVDALNQVGNRFSISSTGLGESLKRSGGAMATANNTLEETIGLTVAANDAMQDPASTGTALRTIALRLRGRHTCLHI